LASLLAVIVTVCEGKASSALAAGAGATGVAGAKGGGTSGGDTAAAAGGALALCSGAGTAGGGACSWAWPSDTTHNHPAQAIHIRMHFFQ